MKKTYMIIFSLLLVLILAACGGDASGSSSTTGAPDSASQDFETRETPIEMQLMLGTVKLDETEYPIGSNQASELLPLWKALRSLSSSETAAQAEVDAVIASIQDGMTAEQMAAIKTMELTMQNFAEIADTLGIETGFGNRFGDMTPEMQSAMQSAMQATMQAARESGEGPPEGFAPGGFGGGQGLGGGQGRGGDFDGTGITPEMRETAMAERGGAPGRGFGINTALLDAVISFLEAK